MTLKEIPIDMCKEMVEGEIRTRGLMLAFVARTLHEKYGQEVVDTMKKALSEAGRLSGNAAANELGKNDLSTIEDIIGDPIWAQILEPELVVRDDDRIVINWCRCPVPFLREAFGDSDFPPDLLETACTLLESYDRAFFEGINPDFVVRGPPDTRRMGLVKGKGPCTLEISLTK